MRRGNLGRALALLAGVVLVSCTEAPISSLNNAQVTPTVQRDNTPSGDVHLVISQVYGAGGNSGSTLKNDYIEIFNPTGTAVKVDGWSVQYQSSAGTGSMQVTNLSGVVQPGRYYLVQESQGSGGSLSLPTPDATGSISMSGTNGKVVLAKTTTAYTGLCASDANVVDEVSFGPSSTGSGSATASNLTATTAATRSGAGCTNTGVTSADFTNVTAAPRNSATTRILARPRL